MGLPKLPCVMTAHGVRCFFADIADAVSLLTAQRTHSLDIANKRTVVRLNANKRTATCRDDHISRRRRRRFGCRALVCLL